MNMMNKWEQGSILTYATSIASTWAWAPALFISGNQAYTNGLPGFLMFFIPNVLTLILFGLFAYYVRTHFSDTNSVTIENMIQHAGKQKKIHLIMTLLILFCSCCMQLMGMFLVLQNYITNKFIASIIILLFALYTTHNGIKSCIKTDLIKYFIIIIIGGILISNISLNNLSLYGTTTQDITTIWRTFGITTMLGLLTAPYIDSTFVQRMYCIPKNKLIKTFCLSALLFAFIPLLYSIFGFAGISHTNTYFTGINGILLLIAVVAALLSTLDSNLCALGAIIDDYIPDYKKQIIIIFYCLASWVMICSPFNITKLFTLYCTIRCTMFIPTLLIITKHYNQSRLFYFSLLACIIGCVGYYFTSDFIYTLLGLLLPLGGLDHITKKE